MPLHTRSVVVMQDADRAFYFVAPCNSPIEMLAAARLLLIFLTLSAWSCSPLLGPGGPDGTLYLTGIVESINFDADYPVVVVRPPEEECGIRARVDRSTRWFTRDAGGQLRRVSRSAISSPDMAEVYLHGGVADSCPGQGYASSIVILI